MLKTVESIVNTQDQSRKNVVINFIDVDGKLRTRNYNIHDIEHRERILKTIEFAVIHKIELRIRTQ